MKVVILAGGLGTRLGEETHLKPKPMVQIGGHPILWHIMKIYSHYGFNDFVILTGYKSHVIKEYFINYYTRYSDITIDMSNNSVEMHETRTEPWKVTMLYTGLESMTGSRIKKAESFLGNEPFLLTYGDGVSDVDIRKTVEFHKSHGKAITMTTVQPEPRFGNLEIDSDMNINRFVEKPQSEAGWINGGFFVCEPKIFQYLSESDDCVFERDPLQKMALDGEMFAYKHTGFWQPMDTLRDNQKLNKMWYSLNAPWKIWE